MRSQLLSLVCEGLPQDYQLLVKAHPSEDPQSTVLPFVRQYAPRAKVVDRYVPVQDVLGVSDILFNRGTSQVVFEALIRRLPAVIVPFGARTAFTGVTKDGPADRAGLRGGDALIRFGDSRIGGLEDFDSALRKYKAGDKVQVVVRRGDEELMLEVTLEDPR